MSDGNGAGGTVVGIGDPANGTPVNGAPRSYDAVREEYKLARLEMKLAEVKARKVLLTESFGNDWQRGTDLWGQTRVFSQRDAAGTGFVPPAQPSDRRHGQEHPLWISDLERMELLQRSRMLARYNSFAKGLLNNIINYLLGKGGSYKAISKTTVDDDTGDGTQDDEQGTDKAAGAEDAGTVPVAGNSNGAADRQKQHKRYLKKVVARFQDFIDAFLAKNRWNAGAPHEMVGVFSECRERETIRRHHQDGDVFLRFFLDEDGIPIIRFIEPEQVRNPTDGTLSEGWSYGIQHRMHPREDVEDVTAYCVWFMDASTSGELFEIVPANEVIHLRGPETPSTVKRGLPTFTYELANALERASRLQKSLSIRSRVQAALALIWKHKTATQASVSSMAQGLATRTFTDPLSGRIINVENAPDGSIARIPDGQEPVDPPSGTGTSEHMAVLQGDLCQAGAGVNLPQFMVASSAEHGDYGSLKEAGGPVVRAGEANQEFFRMAYGAVLRRAAVMGYHAGAIPKECLTLCEIQVELPAVVQLSTSEKTQDDLAKFDKGIKDAQTIIMEDGGDPETVLHNLREWKEKTQPAPQPGVPPGAPGAAPPGGEAAPEAAQPEAAAGAPDLGTMLGQVSESAAGGSAVPAGESAPALDALLLEAHLLEAGFTGTITDKAGHKRRYVDGKQVKNQEVATVKAKAGAKAAGPTRPAAKADGGTPWWLPDDGGKGAKTALPVATPVGAKAALPVAKVVKAGQPKTALPVATPVATPVGMPAAPAATPHGQAAQQWVSGQLKVAKLPAATHQEYEIAAHTVLGVMPKAALARMAAAGGKATFHATNEALSSTLAGRSPKVAALIKSGAKVGGAFNKGTGELSLNGGLNKKTTAEIYAHEFAHAVDGKNFEISSSPEWQAAFGAEIHKGGLSDYAKTNAQEGFAEFGRLVYGKQAGRAELVKKFPKAVAVWEKWGLMPGAVRESVDDGGGGDDDSGNPLLSDVFTGSPVYDGDQHVDVLKSDGAGEAAPVTESETRQFASTQFDLPVAVAAAVRRLADRIAVTDLAADGKEPSPHITVKYGLHAHDPEAVRRAVAGFGPVAVKLGSISLFPADAYDVVKIDVEGAGLRTLNAAIADACPHTDTHPEYVPHITLAYVLPGRGAKYTGGHELVGQTVLLSNLTFSPASGVPVIIPLTGTPVQESVDDDADLGDPAERAGLIAEILAALHGDDALAAFDDEGNGSSPVAESLAVLMSVPRFATLLEAWDKLQHPRGEHGRFIPRGSAEAVAAVHERVKKALAGDRSPTSARDLADHLSILTVKQLHDLKKSHNISASGPTVDSLRAKIADRLDRGRREPGEKAADTTGAAEPTAPLLAIGDKSAEPAPVAEPATPPVAATPEPPTAPERQADAAAEAGTGDDRKRVGKDGVEYARAPAGGATSPVNGQFYKGGHWMPIHGLSPKVEKGAKGAGGGAPPPPPKDDEGKGTKPGRGPMTPEQIEDERQKREDQKKWDEIGAGPLGQMKWLGNNPNHKAVSHPILHIDRWKEFAAGMGEEKLSALADKIKVAVDAKIDADVAAERAKGNVVPEDNVEWEKNTARTSAEQDASMFGGKKHLKEVPSSYYARQLAQQYIGLHPTVEGLHGLHRMLSDAKASTAAGAAAGAATEPAPALPPSPPESELFKATSGYEPEFKYPAANDALRAAWRGDHGPEVQAAVKGERGPELRTSARSLIADHAHDNPEYLARALAKMAGKAQPPASPPLPPAPTPAKTGGPGAVRATPGPGPQAAVKEQPMSTNVSTSAPPVRQPAHPFTGMNEAAKAQAINDIADPFGKTPGAAPAYREAVGAAYESQPDEVKTQLRQRIAAHVAANAKERSVGPANDVLYQRVAAEVPGLTPQAFVGALHAMRDAGELRLTGWPRPASELPNKDVVAVIGTKPMYYASPPG